jgi:hypothetical protein
MCVCSGLSLVCASAAHADMVLGWEETAAGTTGQGTKNVLPVAGSAFYGRTFTTATPVIPGSDAPGYGFYDDFLFWIGPANVDSATVSLNLSNLLEIDNLQVRLYDASTNQQLPVLGTPQGTTIYAASSNFSSPTGQTGMLAVLPTVSLAEGTYVLEIRGDVVGGSGGSYSGVINLSPVPLPAGLSLLLVGLLSIVGLRRLVPAAHDVRVATG